MNEGRHVDHERMETLLSAGLAVLPHDATAATMLLLRSLELLPEADLRRTAVAESLGRAALWAGRPVTAERVSRSILGEVPGEPDVSVARSLIVQGRCAEALPFLDRVVDGSPSPVLRLRALAERSFLHATSVEIAAAEEDAATVLQQASDEAAVCLATMSLALCRNFEGRTDDAIRYVETAIDVADLSRDSEVKRWNPRVLLGAFLAISSDSRAETALREARHVSEHLGDGWDAVPLTWYLALHLFVAGDWDAATGELQRGETLAAAAEVAFEVANIYGTMALIAARRGDVSGAELAISKGRSRAATDEETWLDWSEAYLLESYGDLGASDVLLPVWESAVAGGAVASIAGLLPDFVRIVGEDETLRRRVLAELEGLSPSPPRRTHYELCRAVVTNDVELMEQACLAYQAASTPLYHGLAREERAVALARLGHHDEGRRDLGIALSCYEGLDAVTDAARARSRLRACGVALPPPTGRAASRDGWRSLSPAEHRVAVLVASGCRNREIAERLFISPQTVQTHLKRIFKKLGVRSRLQLGLLAGAELRRGGQSAGRAHVLAEPAGVGDVREETAR